MPKLRKLVLDVMKPHKPSVLIFADRLADLEGVDGVNSSIVEIDREVENIKVTLEGSDIDFDSVEDIIDELGGSVHSVDKVICGQRIIKDTSTPQDRN